MPKGLVIYLDDETYKSLKNMCANEDKHLKDMAYDIIKGSVEAYKEAIAFHSDKSKP